MLYSRICNLRKTLCRYHKVLHVCYAMKYDDQRLLNLPNTMFHFPLQSACTHLTSAGCCLLSLSLHSTRPILRPLSSTQASPCQIFCPKIPFHHHFQTACTHLTSAGCCFLCLSLCSTRTILDPVNGIQVIPQQTSSPKTQFHLSLHLQSACTRLTAAWHCPRCLILCNVSPNLGLLSSIQAT